MDPYQNYSNMPPYANNPYPQMPIPDFSINQQYQQPQQGYGGGGAPMYPGNQTGGGAYPQPGYGYQPQMPSYGGGVPQYPQGGGGGGLNPFQPAATNPSPTNFDYQNPSPYGGYGQGAGYVQPDAYGQGAGYGGGQGAGYGGQGAGYPPAAPQPAPYPGGYQTQPQQQSGPTGNLFPNLASAGGGYAPPPPSSQYSNPGSYQIYEGTVKPFQPFNPVDDAAKLYKAMKGFGTNETALIEVLCRRTNQQRLQIASSFKTAYGKDLLKDVVKETSGDFEDILRSLLLPSVEFEAHELRESLQGVGTDEAALVEIICTKNNAQMLELRQTYRRLFNRDVEKEVRGDVSGYFQRILVSLINANRSEGPADVNRARQLAQELHKAGEKHLGTDEVTFNRIFAAESLAQLKLVFEEYQRLTGHDIERAIKSEMSGDVERAFLAIAKMAKNQPLYFAERLHDSMKGMGTKDRTLIRNVVLRSEIDMGNIKIEFQKRYGKSLESFVKGDLSGDYKRAVLCLIGDPNWK